jgi:hypothetical protein
MLIDVRISDQQTYLYTQSPRVNLSTGKPLTFLSLGIYLATHPHNPPARP